MGGRETAAPGPWGADKYIGNGWSDNPSARAGPRRTSIRRGPSTDRGAGHGSGSVMRVRTTGGACARGTSVTGTLTLSMATLPCGPRG